MASEGTAFQLYVYDCSDSEAASIWTEIVQSYNLAKDWGTGRIHPDEGLEMGQLYCGYGDGGISVEITIDILKDVAPSATWETWEDPGGEYSYEPGDYAAYAPDLGLYRHSCDEEGNATMAAGEIEGILDSLPDSATVADVRQRIRQTCGKAWKDRIATFKSKDASRIEAAKKAAQEALGEEVMHLMISCMEIADRTKDE